MHLPGRDVSWRKFAKDLKDEWSKDRVGDVAGSITYFGILAIFPFLLFLVTLAGFFLNPQVVTQLVDQLSGVAPPEVTQIIGGRLNELASGASPGLLTFGALGALWAASGGMVALMRAFNVVYDVEESRPFWKTRGLALLMVLATAVFVLAASGIAIVAAPIAAAVGGPIGTAVLWLRMPVAALLMMFIWALLYWALPDVEQKFKFITPGSVIGVVVWALASWGFSLYVKNFSNYAGTYGALGGIIVMLLWVWISAQMLLLGAEINSLLEHYSPEGKRAGAKSLADTGASKGASAEGKAGEREAGAEHGEGRGVPLYVRDREAARHAGDEKTGPSTLEKAGLGALLGAAIYKRRSKRPPPHVGE